MRWTTGKGIGVAAVCVVGAVVATTMVIQRTVSADASPQVEPTERNCWDRSTWGYDDPPPPPGCRTPQESGCDAPVPPPSPEKPCDVTPCFVSHDLTPSRGYTLPLGRLQIVTFYDGDAMSTPTLRIEYADPEQGTEWLAITGIQPSTSNAGRIDTFEFDLGAARLTGRFEVRDVVPNGVVDGLAFGLFWRDADGFHVLRSTAPQSRDFMTMVGAWPIGLNDKAFEKRTPQLTSNAARQQARMAVYGAEYLDNGGYLITIQERAVAMQVQEGLD